MSEFGNREFIISATVCTWSCFCWFYRASLSLAAKNIISLLSVLAIWWCPWVVFSYVVGRGCLLWSVCSLGKILSLCPASFCTSRPNLPVTPGISWLSIFSFQSPIKKITSFWVWVLEGLVGLHRTIKLQFLQQYWLGHRLGLLWYWMVSLRNEERSLCHLWDCIQVLLTLVDYDGYSISSTITSHIHNWMLLLLLIIFIIIVYLWLHLIILSGAISPLISSSILGTYWPEDFIFQCPIFLPFHTVYGVLKARILKCFAISFSSAPHFVTTLHHYRSILGGPLQHSS